MLRPATADDVGTAAAVWAGAWRDGHLGHVPPELVEAREDEYFSERLAALLPHVTLAEHDDRVVGVLIVVEDELQQVMVSAAARGLGLGARLLAEGERIVRDAGHALAWLAVVPGNTAARGFYEAHGWRDAGERIYRSQTRGEATVPVPIRRYEKAVVLDAFTGS